MARARVPTATVFCNGFHVKNSALERSSYGSGTIFQREATFGTSLFGRTAGKSRNPLAHGSVRTPCGYVTSYWARRSAGSSAGAPADKVTCGELLDDLLEHAKSNFRSSTEKITRLVIEAISATAKQRA
jgi:hypothetical protein